MSGSAVLVALDEHGDRVAWLVHAFDGPVRETNPTVSPDGRWVVFASSRERASLEETSLWIAPLAPDARPVRLTTGPGIDAQPVWTPDGRAIVFASTRAGTFDLYRQEVREGRATGEPVALTSAASHEITPTIAPDGTIAYAAVTPQADGSVESHLEQLAPDGTIAKLTEGPADSSPAFSPDGARLAFSRPSDRGRDVDADLWVLARGGQSATRLADIPLTDEGGAVWSRDGRFVFATSLLRGAAGNALFSSVIVIDTRASPHPARMLEDRVGAIARATPAVAVANLDAAALDADPEYVPELARITAAAIAKQKQQVEHR